MAFQFLDARSQFILDLLYRPGHPFRPCHVVRRRKDVHLVFFPNDVPCQRMQGVDVFHLVAKELNPDGLFLIHRDDLHRVTAHAEGSPVKVDVIAGVLHADEFAQQVVPVHGVAPLERDHSGHILLRGSQTVDAGHGGHDDHVPAGQQCVGGRVPQAFHLLIDGGVLFDERVRLRHIRFRLVIVVVRDEVLNGVVGQQFPEFIGQLCGQGLVLHHDKRGALDLFNQPRRGGRLSSPGGAQQHHILFSVVDAFGQFLDGRRLVAGRLELTDDFKGCHNTVDLLRKTHGVNATPDVSQPNTPNRRRHAVSRWVGLPMSRTGHLGHDMKA